MPDRNNKTPNNVPGPYYVDDTCVDCGLCPEIAAGTFRRDDLNGVSYVWKQPASAEEIAFAEEALGSCPTESIGNDGAE